jgi:hypothetical protein
MEAIIALLTIGITMLIPAAIDALAALFGAQDIEIDDPGFDRAFVIKGDEPPRVATLLRPDLRLYLMHARQQQFDIQLSDLGVMVQTRGAVTNPVWIESTLSMMAHGAALITAAREQVPIASSLAPHYEVWSSFARAHGLQGMTTPFAMWGDLDGSKVTVSALRTGECCPMAVEGRSKVGRWGTMRGREGHRPTS